MNDKFVIAKTPVFKHELAQITIKPINTVTRFNFPELQNLREVRLYGISFWSASTIKTNIVTQNALVDFATLSQGYLTLQTYDGKEVIKQSPILNFYSYDNQGVTNLTNLGFNQLNGLRINWAKSFIEFPTAPVPANNVDVMMSIFYKPLSQREIEDLKIDFKNKE